MVLSQSLSPTPSQFSQDSLYSRQKELLSPGFLVLCSCSSIPSHLENPKCAHPPAPAPCPCPSPAESLRTWLCFSNPQHLTQVHSTCRLSVNDIEGTHISSFFFCASLPLVLALPRVCLPHASLFSACASMGELSDFSLLGFRDAHTAKSCPAHTGRSSLLNPR